MVPGTGIRAAWLAGLAEKPTDCEKMLSAHPGRTVSRADLIEGVWGTTYTGGSNVVDVVVRSLRQKLGPIATRVETARGIGYRLK